MRSFSYHDVVEVILLFGILKISTIIIMIEHIEEENKKIHASVPEPSPIMKGEIVTQSLVKYLQECNHPTIVELVKERDAFGRKKYGQPLMTEDGRNTLEDIRQEFGDLIQYMWKGIMKQKSEFINIKKNDEDFINQYRFTLTMMRVFNDIVKYSSFLYNCKMDSSIKQFCDQLNNCNDEES